MSVVKPNDITIWNGDIAFIAKEKMNMLLRQMPGYKIQIVGNHDLDRSGKLIDFEVNERHMCYALNVVDGDMEFQLLFTHYPTDNVPKNCVNIHGHIHQHRTPNYWNICTCVEQVNYTPVNLRSIIADSKKRLITRKLD